ncbi:hypothetical protein [Streptomyces sp. NPDC093097]|uniref:hypothetical protein n=1 Tax=Streptomyces sp. NPDC093097 TaxID=3366027 RepID=UPI00380E823B
MSREAPARFCERRRVRFPPPTHPWADGLALGDLVRIQAWGPVTERRYARPSGLEVEVDIGSPDWARTDPVDPGTRRVVTDGARRLHDPEGLLDALIRACRA